MNTRIMVRSVYNFDIQELIPRVENTKKYG